MSSVQERILSDWPDLGATTAKDLLKGIRAQLFRASCEDRLRTPQDGIFKWVKLVVDPEADEEIAGGIKDFTRAPESAKLVRDDGAWIHFTIRVREEVHRLRLVAYDFEIVFPGNHHPGFVRVDLNPPDHPNAAREIRSHIHPGNDDLQWPAPLMTPREILDWMIGPALRARHADKPRM